VLGVDDVALRRGHRYATVIIDALTHRRDRCAARPQGGHVATWLGEHSGAEVVCRDGSAAYAEAIRQGAPKAMQVSEHSHLRHNLGAAVEKSVITHNTCWRPQPAAPPQTAQPVRRSTDAPGPTTRPSINCSIRAGSAGMLPAAQLGVEHGEALCPRRNR
jgi:hypothetical protein